jgi:hypothetical protein
MAPLCGAATVANENARGPASAATTANAPTAAPTFGGRRATSGSKTAQATATTVTITRSQGNHCESRCSRTTASTAVIASIPDSVVVARISARRRHNSAAPTASPPPTAGASATL